MTEEEYIADVKNIKGHRKHKFTGSYTIRDYYYYYNKQKKGLTEHQFSSILKEIFKRIAEHLSMGEDLKLPHKMGSLEIRKRPKVTTFKHNKVRTNLPIDWNETLKLWYSDAKCREKKKVVRCDVPDIFKVYYNKKRARYNNMGFMKFRTARSLKLALKQEIQNNNLDSFCIHER